MNAKYSIGRVSLLNVRHPLISSPSKFYPNGCGLAAQLRCNDDLLEILDNYALFKEFMTQVGILKLTVKEGDLNPRLDRPRTLDEVVSRYTLPWHSDIFLITLTPCVARRTNVWDPGGIQVFWQLPTSLGRASSTVAATFEHVAEALEEVMRESPQDWVNRRVIPRQLLPQASRLQEHFFNHMDLNSTGRVMAVRDFAKDDAYGESTREGGLCARITEDSFRILRNKRQMISMGWRQYRRGAFFAVDQGELMTDDLPIAHARWNHGSSDIRGVFSTTLPVGDRGWGRRYLNPELGYV